MPAHRPSLLGMFALLALVCSVNPVRADMPVGPWPWSRKEPAPRFYPGVEPLPPTKSAPGGCGTGAGLSLAGIAMVWGVCWAGQRLIGKRPTDRS